MIRQISHIIIAAMLFLTTTGLTVHQHFCMGTLVERSIFHEPAFCCGEGADCCNNVSETYQLDEDFVFFSNVIDFDDQLIELPELPQLFVGPWETQGKTIFTYKIFHPPDLATVLARLQVFCL